MTILGVIGLVVLGGIVVIAGLAWLFDRARKEIDSLKLDEERL